MTALADFSVSIRHVAAAGMIALTVGASSFSAQSAAPGAASQAPIISQGVYQENKSRTNCGNVASCSISFSAVPAGKTLIVRNFNCQVLALPGGTPLGLRFGGPTYFTLVQYNAIAGSGLRYYISNNDVWNVFKAGGIPNATILLSSPANITSFVCTIGGELKP